MSLYSGSTFIAIENLGTGCVLKLVVLRPPEKDSICTFWLIVKLLSELLPFETRQIHSDGLMN